MGVFGSPHPSRLLTTTGSASTFPRTAGTYTAPGLVIPFGSLDTWFQYTRGLSPARRGEIICFGDSTTFGSGGLYSWLTRLRSRAVAAGWADGGKGIFAGGESSITYDPGEINGFVSATGFANSPDSFDILQGNFFYDASTAGDALTLQFKASCARLWYVSRSNAGEFTYTVDGGAPVTVNANTTGAGGCRFVYLSGYDPAVTHTIVITNRAGRTATAPTSILNLGLDGLGTGTLAAGTYYYVATYVFSGGETLPSPASSITTGGTRNISIAIPNVGQSSANIYRSTSSGGPFQFITSTSAGGTGTAVLYNDGGLTPTAQVPPTTGTTNLNTSAQGCYVALAPMNDTGLVVQKYATSGATFGVFFMGAGTPTPTTPYQYGVSGVRTQPAFGLNITTMTGPNYDTGQSVDTTLPAAGRVKPVLAIADLGFNDLSGAGYNVDPAYWVEYVKRFASQCRVAGVSGLVTSGQLPYNASWATSGAAVFAAARDTATAQGLAFADLFYPIGGASLSYAGGASNPHLTKTQYQAQADFLWDNLLGVA